MLSLETIISLSAIVGLISAVVIEVRHSRRSRRMWQESMRRHLASLPRRVADQPSP